MNARWAVAGLAVVLLAAAGAWAVGVVGVTARVPVYEIERGRFVHRVQAEGVLEAEQATELKVPMGGDMMKSMPKIAWLAEDGTRVSEGEAVIRFDPTDMEQELFSGEIDRQRTDQQIRQRELEQDTAIDNLDRDADLAELQLQHASEFQSTDEEIFSQKEIAESEIDRTLATRRKEHTEEVRGIREDLGSVELQLLELQRRQAQLQIDRAAAGLQALELRAPHDGIFVLNRDRRGEVMTIGQIAWPGMTLGQLPRLEEMKAIVYVLEADAGDLEPGIPADVRIEAHPESPVGATVRRVANVAQRRARWSPVQYFEVELELTLTDIQRMKPGQRVMATLEIADLDDVVAVPREAVFRDAEGEPIVYVRSGRGFEARSVTLGPTALGRVVVETGLEDGDVVALEDPTRGSADETEANGGPAAPGMPTGGAR